MIFEQGENSVSFLSEETESKYTFPDVIRTNDRATMMELIRQIHAFTICCGIMDDVYKKQGFIAVPIDTDETMKIGYVTLKNAKIISGQRGVCKAVESVRSEFQCIMFDNIKNSLFI